ncbi:MAG TPA: 4'-phosphopantetheinyl transferase superfamily protein [Fredinandcohnia sp.]|nr:4'-phosphopantetheinyl transferase superfamily protein [Fredinandcohnia sp.]
MSSDGSAPHRRKGYDAGVRAGDLSHRGELYCKLLVRDHPFGMVVAVALPEGTEPVPARQLEALPEAERDYARTLRGRRQIEWVGGRLALRLAAATRGLELGPVLPGPWGGPDLPPGIVASISHKRRIAAAVIATGEATLGLDVEALAPKRPAIARRILDAEELERWQDLPETSRWSFLVRRFSLKEATYKAIHPHLRRYVGFAEAHVARAEPGDVSIFVRTRAGEPRLCLEADCLEMEGHVWALVRARRE